VCSLTATKLTCCLSPPPQFFPQLPSATLSAAMAKRFATDSCFDLANHALQLLGGYGYLQVSWVKALNHALQLFTCSSTQGTWAGVTRSVIHSLLSG